MRCLKLRYQKIPWRIRFIREKCRVQTVETNLKTMSKLLRRKHSTPGESIWLCAAFVALGEVIVSLQRCQHGVQWIKLQLLGNNISPLDGVLALTEFLVGMEKGKRW